MHLKPESLGRAHVGAAVEVAYRGGVERGEYRGTIPGDDAARDKRHRRARLILTRGSVTVYLPVSECRDVSLDGRRRRRS